MEKVSVQHGNAKITLEFEDTPLKFQDALAVFEKSVIHYLLQKNDGIKARVAKTLSMNRTTLVEKARKYGFPLKK